jgi:dolichol-phosphate mannosyltransferase
LHTPIHDQALPETAGGIFIILPVLNEIANIGSLLDKIHAALAGVPFTIGIVDDGSTDRTVEYLKERSQSDRRLHVIYRVKTHHGSQRGAALRTLMLWGLEKTSHDVFVEMDGDLSHRPEELPEGIRLIRNGTCDVAIASKYIPGSSVINRPWGRLMVSKICSYAVRLLLSSKVRDYSNGYRFYTRDAARIAAEHKSRYGSPIYLSEILALWLRSGLRVTEFKTLYVGRNEGISKLRIEDLVKAAIATFEIAARYHITGFPPEPLPKPHAFQQPAQAVGDADPASEL